MSSEISSPGIDAADKGVPTAWDTVGDFSSIPRGFVDTGIQLNTDIQHETEAGFPTKELLMPRFPSGQKGNLTGAPQGKDTYYAHEGIVVINGNNVLSVMPYEPKVIDQLRAQGAEEYAQFVPYTGAGNVDRNSKEYREHWRGFCAGLTYHRASEEAGLRELDTLSMNPKALEELRRKTGFHVSKTNPGEQLLAGDDKVYVVSRGLSREVTGDPSAPLDDGYGLDITEVPETVKDRAEQIGTFARFTADVSVPGYDYPCVALVDQGGNQIIAPETKALTDLLSALGYKEQAEPTFDTSLIGRTDKNNPDRFNPVGQRLNTFVRALVSR